MLKQRIRKCNDKDVQLAKPIVLYWMQAYRRFDSNHAFDYAVHLAKKYDKELVVYEGLRKDYPWNSKRIHKFILEGMYENQNRADTLGINYWPFVESEKNPAKHLLKNISQNVCLIVTDDFPCFIIPEQTSKLAEKVDCAVFSVDGNSLIPFSQYEKEASAARILRIWIHKKIQNFIATPAKFKWSKKDLASLNRNTLPPMQIGLPKDLTQFLNKQIFLESVIPHHSTIGGRNVALQKLKIFITTKLKDYDKSRSNPNSPFLTPSSGLSPYIHFGFISVEEIFWTILNEIDGNWSPERLSHSKPGDRENFYCKSQAVNMFFDELITWRDIGYLFFWKNKPFSKDLSSLPDWVKKNFEKHHTDPKDYLYELNHFESAITHDPLWNAAQKELIHTGTMHNYMRMLWGKKVIEWSKSYDDAFQILEHLNNKYAYDGRNPNSYTGILWCFGLFDRPWFPERNVFGNVRFMSSDSTKKKFKMNSYLDYIDSLDDHNSRLFP
ncbi:deoxyribodipyrimidine photolyase [Leptospira sp. 96542]|nr:deoxyribodipyrimidine photolyase [Leptospira sp. 96542]